MYTIKKITSSPIVDFAAEELKKYLRMMMPRAGEIAISYDPDATEGFRLGVMADFALDTSEADDIELDDIIHIDTDAEGGIIAGSNERSVLLAVYKYLTINGCRWLFPGIDGEFIPVKAIEPTKYHKMADSRYRGQCNEGAESQQCMMETIDFTPKLGMNVYMLECDIPENYYGYYYNHTYNDMNREPEPVSAETVLQWKRQCEVEMAKRGLQFHDIGHGFTTGPFGFDNQTKYDDNHPLVEEMREHLPLINGKRGLTHNRPWDTNFCMSNPKSRKIVTDYVADYAALATNEDYLHVWLGDSFNFHCECEECQKKTPSDWYVILLNEMDEEFTRRGLTTRIVFIAYLDTMFCAETEKIKNPKRFTLLFAPISRKYTESIPTVVCDRTDLPKYMRNKNLRPTDKSDLLTRARQWKEWCGVNVIVYEYHFWINYYFEPTVLKYARILHDDVLGYAAHGFKGIIQDGSQRCFFPNGLPWFVYANTLFDHSLTFEELRDDYFFHAYGEDYKEVIKFFEDLGEVIDHEHWAGEKTTNPAYGNYFNPELGVKLRKVKEIVEGFHPFVEAHKNMPKRPQTVAYRLLWRYFDYVTMLSEVVLLKSFGAAVEARRKFEEFKKEFGKYELEIERYHEQVTLHKGFDWRILKKDDEELNFGI